MKVYVVSLQFATDDADGVDIEVFGTYDKAVKRFKELIENEKNPEMSWVANAFENGVLQHGYELDSSPEFTDGEEHELWWNITCKVDWCLHTFIELRFSEVQ